MDLNPQITKYIEKKIILNQDNKCARKPYSRIKGLMNYNCRLWKKERNKGQFIDIDYNFVKINGGLIALCNSCYRVLVNRKKRSDSKINKQEYIPVMHINSSYNNLNIPSQYKVVYYPNDRPGEIDVFEIPLISSKMIGNVFYGDILDVYDDLNNWICINFNGTKGYIAKMYHNHIIVKKLQHIESPEIEKQVIKIEKQEIVKIEKQEAIKIEKQCCICSELILNIFLIDPCGHTNVCSECSKKINKCPLCYKTIIKTIKVY